MQNSNAWGKNVDYFSEVRKLKCSKHINKFLLSCPLLCLLVLWLYTSISNEYASFIFKMHLTVWTVRTGTVWEGRGSLLFITQRNGRKFCLKIRHMLFPYVISLFGGLEEASVLFTPTGLDWAPSPFSLLQLRLALVQSSTYTYINQHSNPKDGGSILLQNIHMQPQEYTVQQPRRM